MHYATTLLIALAFAVSGCAATQQPSVIPAESEVTGFDFSKYTAQGFLITPLAYEGDYQSIGVLRVRMFPQAFRASGETAEGLEGVDAGDYVTQSIEPSEAIDSLYSVAQQMGADAVINFDVTATQKRESGVTVTGYEASGFAIDRQN